MPFLRSYYEFDKNANFISMNAEMLFVLNWFGDYRSLRFLCGYFGWRTFYFLLQKGCYSMEDRKKAFSVLGILVGVGMIIAGVSILISSNVEPSTVFLRDFPIC